ncbi:hypothetical protein C5167_038334 [Papaver somniferum]|uniref:RNase H type-1 domain-containing protein n=1 Tax=Papaver somniferum TaxID=3469 RepID=A0A4Y7IC53_PAPSO|nr:hypothetical protein C5167_038334 [Papaver somniferum]
MFADDFMLFGNTTISSVTSILQKYYSASGQLVNYNKSSIHFSKGVEDATQNTIISTLGVNRMSTTEKYLEVKILQQGSRAIWKARNSVILENKQINVQGTLKKAFFWFHLYYNYNDQLETEIDEQSHANSVQAVDWSPPPPLQSIKINVDAAFKDGRYAGAAVARNHCGDICGAVTKTGLANASVMAEAMGFYMATELAQWLGFSFVIIEGDCQTVVNTLKGISRSPPWRIWKIIDDIKAATRGVADVHYSFTPKQANSLAHEVAAYAFTHNVQARWTATEIPLCISQLANLSS